MHACMQCWRRTLVQRSCGPLPHTLRVYRQGPKVRVVYYLHPETNPSLCRFPFMRVDSERKKREYTCGFPICHASHMFGAV